MPRNGRASHRRRGAWATSGAAAAGAATTGAAASIYAAAPRGGPRALRRYPVRRDGAPHGPRRNTKAASRGPPRTLVGSPHERHAAATLVLFREPGGFGAGTRRRGARAGGIGGGAERPRDAVARGARGRLLRVVDAEAAEAAGRRRDPGRTGVPQGRPAAPRRRFSSKSRPRTLARGAPGRRPQCTR